MGATGQEKGRRFRPKDEATDSIDGPKTARVAQGPCFDATHCAKVTPADLTDASSVTFALVTN
jgi:hypothetical protein